MTSSTVFLNGNPLFFFLILIALLSKGRYKNFIILHKEIFEKKKNKFGKNKFYNEQKQVKNCVTKYLKLWN
jgi:hypothetical protein